MYVCMYTRMYGSLAVELVGGQWMEGANYKLSCWCLVYCIVQMVWLHIYRVFGGGRLVCRFMVCRLYRGFWWWSFFGGGRLVCRFIGRLFDCSSCGLFVFELLV